MVRFPRRLEAAQAAVSRADLIVANLLFIEDHIEAIAPSIEAPATAATPSSG